MKEAFYKQKIALGGKDMRKLKKVVLLVFAVIFVMAFTACEKYDTRASGEDTAAPSFSKPETTQAQSSDTSTGNKLLIITVGNQTLEVELNDSDAAKQLVEALPQKISMSRWGDGEYYGKISIPISSEEEKRDDFDVGEVALWPSGNAFCIFFGPTPASDGEKPKMASPGILLGKITSDISKLKSMRVQEEMTLSLKSVSASGQKSGISGTLDISFPYVYQDGIASNQFAVWIENESGKFIKTLFITQFTATGGYEQRKEAVPTWVEKSKIKQDGAKGVDTVTGATPKSGNMRYTWDCKDQNGNPVPTGKYKFFVEGTARWKNRVLYSGTIQIGGSQVSAEAVPEYSTEEAKQSNMIGQVRAVYNP